MNEVTFQTPPPKPDPLAIPGVVRIALEPHQAATLAELGACFVVISPASYPSQPGLAMLALPVSHKTASDACRVAMGEARAARIKPAAAANVAQPRADRGDNGGTHPLVAGSQTSPQTEGTASGAMPG